MKGAQLQCMDGGRAEGQRGQEGGSGLSLGAARPHPHRPLRKLNTPWGAPHPAPSTRAGPAFPGGALPVTAQHGSPRALDTAATSAYALDALMVPLESESH